MGISVANISATVVPNDVLANKKLVKKSVALCRILTRHRLGDPSNG